MWCLVSYVGEIVIAVNPYRWLPLYSEELRRTYASAGARRRGGGGGSNDEEGGEGGSAEDLPPHVYATSVSAYSRMAAMQDSSPQVTSLTRTSLTRTSLINTLNERNPSPSRLSNPT